MPASATPSTGWPTGARFSTLKVATRIRSKILHDGGGFLLEVRSRYRTIGLGRVHLILAVGVVDDAGHIAQPVAGLKVGEQRHACFVVQLNALRVEIEHLVGRLRRSGRRVADGQAAPRIGRGVGADARRYELLVKSRVEGTGNAHIFQRDAHAFQRFPEIRPLIYRIIGAGRGCCIDVIVTERYQGRLALKAGCEVVDIADPHRGRQCVAGGHYVRRAGHRIELRHRELIGAGELGNRCRQLHFRTHDDAGRDRGAGTGTQENKDAVRGPVVAVASRVLNVVADRVVAAIFRAGRIDRGDDAAHSHLLTNEFRAMSGALNVVDMHDVVVLDRAGRDGLGGAHRRGDALLRRRRAGHSQREVLVGFERGIAGDIHCHRHRRLAGRNGGVDGLRQRGDAREVTRIGRGGRELQCHVDRTDGAICPLDREVNGGGAGCFLRRATRWSTTMRRGPPGCSPSGKRRIDRQARAAIGAPVEFPSLAVRTSAVPVGESAALMNLVTSGALPSPAAGGL